MKIRPIITLVAFLAGFVCIGCIPYHFTIRPGAIGTVIDARTGAPVAGAAVSVMAVRGEDPVGTATTAADGSFTVAPRRQWGVYIIPQDIFAFPFTLSIKSDAYQQVIIEFAQRAMGEGTATNFGVVKMDVVTK